MSDTDMNLPTLNLLALEGMALRVALQRAATLEGAAALLGITRHALARRMTRHSITRHRAKVYGRCDFTSERHLGAGLTGRDAELFNERLASDKPLSLAALGRRWGVTASRVGQMQTALALRLRAKGPDSTPPT